MPPLWTDKKRRTAMAIVIAEEEAKGWVPTPPGSWAKEEEYRCDLLSMPPGGGDPHPVEVKGWGEPMFTAKGTFTYGQDIRTSQFEAASKNDSYRVEIVANLDAFLRGQGRCQRLTLSAKEIRLRAVPRLYDISLAGLEERVWTTTGVGPSQETALPQ